MLGLTTITSKLLHLPDSSNTYSRPQLSSKLYGKGNSAVSWGIFLWLCNWACPLLNILRASAILQFLFMILWIKLKLDLKLSLIKDKTQKAVINIVNFRIFFKLYVSYAYIFKRDLKFHCLCLLILNNLRCPKFFWRMVCSLGAYYTKVSFPLSQ